MDGYGTGKYRRLIVPKRKAGEHLTVLEQKFVNEYLVDPNGVRAYRRASGDKISYANARSEACKLLTRPNVRAEIDAGMKAVSRYAKVKAAKVVKGLATVALADPLDFLDRETGNPLPLDQVPRRARMSVKSIKAKVVSRKLEKFTDDGGEEQIAEVTTEIIEIGLNDRVAALDKLMKHLGQYMQDNQQKFGVKSDAEADALREKLKQRGLVFDVANPPAPSSN